MALIAIPVVACGGSGSPPQAADQYVTAYNAFAGDVHSAIAKTSGSTAVTDYQAAFSALGSSASTFTDALKAIPFPDSAKADADTLVRAVVVFQQGAVGPSKLTDATAVGPAITQDLQGMQAVSAAAAILRNDLGIPAPS